MSTHDADYMILLRNNNKSTRKPPIFIKAKCQVVFMSNCFVLHYVLFDYEGNFTEIRKKYHKNVLAKYISGREREPTAVRPVRPRILPYYIASSSQVSF